MSNTVQFLCKSITNTTKTVADKIILAISYVSNLIEGNDKVDENNVKKAVRELNVLFK